MKIHNYGNDYIHANKLKEERVNNVGVQTAEDRPMPPFQVQEEVGEDIDQEETQAEEKENKRGRKKKQAD